MKMTSNQSFLGSCSHNASISLQETLISEKPELAWTFRLPSYPVRGPESMPCFDSRGNSYFGAHDGMIYSLDCGGKLRWSFRTPKKVYSSPIYERRTGLIIFADGLGTLLSFSPEGQLIWVCDAYDSVNLSKSIPTRCLKWAQSRFFRYDPPRRRIDSTDCWSSPIVVDESVYFATRWRGVSRHRLSDGSIEWTFSPGSPANTLSGLSSAGSWLYLSGSDGHSYALDMLGNPVWRKPFGILKQAWGVSSISSSLGVVLFPYDVHEHRGGIFCRDLVSGELIWHFVEKNGGIRGSVAIGGDACFGAFGTTGGDLVLIDLGSGQEVSRRNVTAANRGLWTTPLLVNEKYILITTKDNNNDGRFACFDNDLNILWEIPIGKSLSVPSFRDPYTVLVGSWSGSMMAFKFQKKI